MKKLRKKAEQGAADNERKRSPSVLGVSRKKKDLSSLLESLLSEPMSIAEIEKMTTPERLRTMEALWDALCHEKSEPDSPQWHEDVLTDRRRKIDSGEAKFISIDEAKRRINE